MHIFKIGETFYVQDTRGRGDDHGSLNRINEDFSSTMMLEGNEVPPIQQLITKDDTTLLIPSDPHDLLVSYDNGGSVESMYIAIDFNTTSITSFEKSGDEYTVLFGGRPLSITNDLQTYSPLFPQLTSYNSTGSKCTVKDGKLMLFDRAFLNKVYSLDNETGEYIYEFDTSIWMNNDVNNFKFVNDRYIWSQWGSYSNNYAHIISSSADGINTDTSYVTNSGSNSGYITFLEYINGEFVYGHRTNSTSYTHRYYTSADLENWSAKSAVTIVTNNSAYLTNLVFDGTYYFVRNSTNLLRTPDLNTAWSTIVSGIPNQSIITACDGVITRYTLGQTQIAVSTNSGSTFTTHTFPSNCEFRTIASDNDKIVIMFYNTVTTLPEFEITTNGIDWTLINNLPATFADLALSQYTWGANLKVVGDNIVCFSNSSTDPYNYDIPGLGENTPGSMMLNSSDLGQSWTPTTIFGQVNNPKTLMAPYPYYYNYFIGDRNFFTNPSGSGLLSINLHEIIRVDGEVTIIDRFFYDLSEIEDSSDYNNIIFEKNWFTNFDKCVTTVDDINYYILPIYTNDGTRLLALTEDIDGNLEEYATLSFFNNFDPYHKWGITHDGTNFIIYNSLYVFMAPTLNSDFTVYVLEPIPTTNSWKPVEYTGDDWNDEIPVFEEWSINYEDFEFSIYDVISTATGDNILTMQPYYMGIDNTWTEVGEARYVDYTVLPPEFYTFERIASNVIQVYRTLDGVNFDPYFSVTLSDSGNIYEWSIYGTLLASADEKLIFEVHGYDEAYVTQKVFISYDTNTTIVEYLDNLPNDGLSFYDGLLFHDGYWYTVLTNSNVVEIVRSVDLSSWDTVHTEIFPDYMSVFGVAYLLYDGQNLIICIDAYDIYIDMYVVPFIRSIDGTTWEVVPDNFSNPDNEVQQYFSNGDGRLFLVSYKNIPVRPYQIYVSNDSGDTWTYVNDVVTEQYIDTRYALYPYYYALNTGEFFVELNANVRVFNGGYTSAHGTSLMYKTTDFITYTRLGPRPFETGEVTIAPTGDQYYLGGHENYSSTLSSIWAILGNTNTGRVIVKARVGTNLKLISDSGGGGGA